MPKEKPKGEKGQNGGNSEDVGNVARAKPARVPGKRSAEATFIPSHGKGRLLPPIRPGEARNPSGRPRTLRDIRRLARGESMDALIALIGCYKRPDGKIDRAADGKIVSAAAQAVIKIAYGDMPAYDPTMERPETRIDLEGMTLAERKHLLSVMDRITTVVTDPRDDDDDEGPTFDPSRFSVEPPTIEAEPVAAVPPAPVKKPRKPRGKKPKPRGRPRKEVAAALEVKRLRKPGRPKKLGRPRKRAKRIRTPKPAVRVVSLFDDGDFE